MTWERILAPKEDGGLGLGSIKAMNLALLAKWKWKFFHEQNSIWAKVINGIHNLGSFPPTRLSSRHLGRVWKNIDKCKNSLRIINIVDSDIIRRNQEETRRESDFAIDGKFHDAGLRGRINRAGHLTPDGAFTWSKWIPNKVNCFVWRARIDRIPSACALIRRGVKIQDETCSACISGSETADHMLVTCPFAIAIWNGIWNWCEIIPPQLSNVKEILNFVAMCGKPQTKKRTINSIIFGTLWGMWKARNDRVFNSKFIPPELVFKGVRCMVYTWIKFRHGK